MKCTFFYFCFCTLVSLASLSNAQETVFTLFKNHQSSGDELFKEKNYYGALKLYQNALRKSPSDQSLGLKVVRCHYFLKQYREAVALFEKYKESSAVQSSDWYLMGEAYASLTAYGNAVLCYKKSLEKNPDDQTAIRKIWRLNNIKYLFEDSLRYTVAPIEVNTSEGEMCAVPYGDGIVFLSNRKEVSTIKRVDASFNIPFYKLYYASSFNDFLHVTLRHSEASIFETDIDNKYHSGPVSFYDSDQKVAIVLTGNDPSVKGKRTLKLYFAEKTGETWSVKRSFPYNSNDYSISDPTINEEGTILYFSSDMKGGSGGKDIYRSKLINGIWSKPENLGEMINTPFDEVFPYLHQSRTLYFASNGLPGLGGLDIFKSDIIEAGYTEPENMGYPINTNFDDFALVIHRFDKHGYFSSNRKGGGFQDDIFEFDMDVQAYPLAITGTIKFKEFSWSETSELKLLPNAKIYLMDVLRNVTVYEGDSDFTGNFSIVIPYYSRYKIKVVLENGDEAVVSLDIPRSKKADNQHEIVIVKDAFKSGSENAVAE